MLRKKNSLIFHGILHFLQVYSQSQKKRIGKEIGVTRVNNLNIELSKLGRVDDILKAAQDKEYQEKLFVEFGL